MEPSHRSLTRRRGYVVFFWIVCLIFWLIPFFNTGWSRKRWNWLPRIVNYQHSASALFTTEIKGWRDYHIEWKRQDGKWFEMKEQILFPTVRYGHRTRYDIILSRNDHSKGRESLFLRLAKHAIKEGRAAGVLNDVTGVRFVAVSWPMGSAELTEAKGAWKDTRVSALPAKWQRVVAEFEIRGSTVKAVKATQVSGRRTLKPSLPATKSMAPSTAVPGTPVKETPQPASLLPPPTPPPSRALLPNLPPTVDVPKSSLP